MTDPRLEKLARVLCEYPLKLKQGDMFLIQATDLAAPLVRAVYYEALLAGAHPYLKITLDGIAEILYKAASDEQLSYISDVQKLEMDQVSAVLTILSSQNTRNLAGVNLDRVAVQKRAGKPISERILERISLGELRWCATLFPTHASAQEANLSLTDFEDFYFSACAIDQTDPVAHWRKVESTNHQIISFLSKCKKLRLKCQDTDLQFDVTGRTWINGCGHENFPDGEIYTTPIEKSVAGTIRFSYPLRLQECQVDNVKLSFEQGQVVRVEAGLGLDYLKRMLEVDDGAGFVGKFGFGVNTGITLLTKSHSLDTKMDGTINLSLGAAPPRTGGTNRSSLHLPMIQNLRTESEIFADGELFYQNGKFLI
ncbi:MAG: aminopeptidase [bacterium]|nr:aminopeptidase [bacterium]